MKFPIKNHEFQFISDNSSECNAQIAFIKTKQNSNFLQNAKENGACQILTVDELKKIYEIEDIKIIGITGTNGKTTTAAAIYSLLLDLDKKVAFQGTRGLYVNEERQEEKTLTTPPILKTLHNLYVAKENGCEFFIMEVSSHAIVQERIEGLKFALKVFTNITQDHLDFHKTFDEYFRVKSSFFSDDSVKLINKDAKKITFNPKNCYTYALDVPASFNILAYTLNDGLTAAIKHFDTQEEFHSPMFGFFNLYNMMAAIGSVKILTDFSLAEICAVCENFAGVSGRMEVVSEKPLVIVDFAHTPDGMDKVLGSFVDKDISVVFGAGGDRDASKRVMMGRVADRHAKKIYLTNDNPRSEESLKILEDIDDGIVDKNRVTILPDRKEAIEVAIDELEEGEVLLILGKGDEAYQEIGSYKLPFDDRVVTKAILKEKFNH
ncbi:MAG TPA: UDP-N-acetylmuramoyl-L-alanyl-D-glutamate--2,6-diaminopimelate ligase [Campylobacterales bacterium]|nr:UDP-N-acetylmuramoyl-L-alanyl-D-glutamate--2,6-diaminopimelate ligase [Campylobacterales bacterium]